MDAKYQKIVDSFNKTDHMLSQYDPNDDMVRYATTYRNNLLDELAGRFEQADKMFSRIEFFAACGRQLVPRRK